ncbi:MAG: hypothetical protein WBF93_13345 [Pirellulales bacterium]
MTKETSVVRCANCEQQLPLILDEQSDDACRWACTNCGEIREGVFDTAAPNELWGNVRREDIPPITG